MPSVTEDTPWHSLKNTTAGQQYPRTRRPVVAAIALRTEPKNLIPRVSWLANPRRAPTENPDGDRRPGWSLRVR